MAKVAASGTTDAANAVANSADDAARTASGSAAVSGADEAAGLGSRRAQRGVVGDLERNITTEGDKRQVAGANTDSLTVPEMLFEATGRPYNNGTLTPAGRAATKHPEYFGFNSTNELKTVYRTDSQLNELARQHIITKK
ncbi:hypothetical protein [Vandammella animalimorsus]|uniref:hypothetical protein n=1 Tax=Vandammella animalimorsus TaxID=2029117 RepID=UPI0011C3E087|nr:hypothetical protein [Vandammella animalimorsus]